MFDSAEQKNKLLRTVAGGGVEQIGNLQARWDKFEIMMESHQLMVKEQVSGLSIFIMYNALKVCLSVLNGFHIFCKPD